MNDDYLERYFKWICRIVGCEGPDKEYLLRSLFAKDFIYSLPMDSNRESDGINLRYRFALENDIPYPIVASELDCRPCSVLEMMVALCLRLEESIMRDDDIGSRTGQWFWEMVNNLEIYPEMSSLAFDIRIGKFLNREYQPNGRGGLFYIPNPYVDMRSVEIWCQAMWWLDIKLNN